VEESQKKSHGVVNVKIQNVYKVHREAEHAAFKAGVGNVTSLFHGSRIANWVGLLSRGILLPKVVVSLGVKRTDPVRPSHSHFHHHHVPNFLIHLINRDG
jgi:hypothetical protein